MANIFNADDGAISGSAGIKLSSDTSGVLNIQTNGVTAISIAANQVVSFPATVGINFNGQIQFEAGTALIPAISTVADTNTGIYFPGADQIAISTGGVQRFFVGATGDVGIGTGSPGARLDIVNTARIQLRASNSTSAIELWKDATPTFAASIGPGSATGISSSLKFDIYNGTSWSTAATIDASGNLGLGVTPSAWGTTNLKAFQIGNSAFWNQTNTDNVYLSSNNYYDGTNYKYIISDFAAEYSMTNGRHIWSTAASGTAGNNVTFTEVMRLDASGNLGVGATSITAGFRGLFVGDSAANHITVGVRNTNTTGISRLVLGNDAGLARFTVGYTGSTASAPFGASLGYIGTEAAEPMLFQTNGTERARLTAAGELCIQRTTPTFNSNNRGNITIGGTDSSILFLGTGNGTGSYVFHEQSTAGMEVWNTANGYIRFGTNAAERARITSGGDLLVGTTTGAFNRIVKNLSGNYALQVVNSSATSPYCMEFNMSGVTGGTGTAFLVCYDNANRLVIYGNGDVKNSNNSYGSLSDIKLKQDVVDAASQWNDIKSLRVRKYRFKENPNAALQIGLIAQELEQVSPGLVDESPDRDREGNYLGTTTKAIKYSVLYMKAIKALQEAMARIESLEAKVATLEAK